MAHLHTVDPSTATGDAKAALNAVKSAVGAVPNLTRVLANSPNALNSYLGFSGALKGGALPATLAEQIALAVAGFNGCEYCAAAHTFIGSKTGLSREELTRNLEGTSDNPRTAAALTFALAVVRERGHAGKAAIEAVRSAGFTDGEIVEIIAHVALNTFTNYVNIAADVDVDFPKVDLPGGRVAA